MISGASSAISNEMVAGLPPEMLDPHLPTLDCPPDRVHVIVCLLKGTYLDMTAV